MVQVKSLAVCVMLVFVWQHAEAAKLHRTRNNQRYDEALQTDIYETIVDDMQADATTVYPPLVEEPVNPALNEVKLPSLDETKPTNSNENKTPAPEYSVVQQPESVSEVPVGQYINPSSQYYNPYYNPYQYYQGYPYPYPYVPQQYFTQPANIQGQQQQQPQPQQQQQQQQQPAYFAVPEFEGILVPVQQSQQQPTRSQLPSSSSQATQAQSTPLNLELTPVTQYVSPAAATTVSANNSEQSKTPAPITNRHSFDLAMLLQTILPQNIIQLIIIIGNFILSSFSTLAFAGALTSLLCSLTPVCTLSFGSLPLGFRRMVVNGTEISTIQRVRRAAEMVTNALEKYEKLQKGVESLTNSLKQAQKKS